MKRIRKDNQGFSLIELLITIVILGIVIIPLINAFSHSARLNQKSQRVHSAATLGQSVVEEVKSSDVNALVLGSVFSAADLPDKTYADLEVVNGKTATEIKNLHKKAFLFDYTPVAPSAAETKVITYNPDAYKKLVVVRENQTATDGGKYDLRITLDPMAYSVMGGTNASNTNVADIAELQSIDNSKGAVIASEINQYDKTASADPMADIMYEKLGGRYTIAQLTSLGITKADMYSRMKKAIDFIYDGASSYTVDGTDYYSMDVTCKVTYTYTNSNLSPSTYQEEVVIYQGTYNYTPNLTNEEGVLDTHIFWNPSCYSSDAVRIINRTGNWLNVYFVRQQDSTGGYDTTGTLEITGGGALTTPFVPTSYTDGKLDETTAKVHLISNMGYDAMTGKYSTIYEKRSLLRCYELTVALFEPNGTDVYDMSATPLTEVKSTKEVYK